MEKTFAKKVLTIFFRGFSIVIASVLSIFFIPLGYVAKYTDQYSNLSVFVSHVPLSTGDYLRYFYYKFTLKSLGKDVIFKYGTFCQYSNACIGSRVTFGYYNSIGLVTIGNDVITGGFVNFLSGLHQHSYNNPNQKIIEQLSPGRVRITIGSDVWIGSNCVIASNIGNRSVIGTGSIVIHTVEDNSLYAGNPAKLIKKI